MNIEFNKVKRIFAFGCSFTKHCYPTWADIISKEAPNALYINLAITGLGNQGISSRLVEASKRFKFCDTDLILLMYSTTFREDRYIGDGWKSYGSVYNNHFYDRQFIDKYVDPIGMLIRDLATMELTNNYIESLSSQSIVLRSVPIDNESDDNRFNRSAKFRTLLQLYKGLLDSMPPTLLELELNNQWRNHVRYQDMFGEIINDSHPTPDVYYSYLKKIGLNLTDKSDIFVQGAMGKLNNCRTLKDLQSTFPEQFNTTGIML